MILELIILPLLAGLLLAGIHGPVIADVNGDLPHRLRLRRHLKADRDRVYGAIGGREMALPWTSANFDTSGLGSYFFAFRP